MTWRVVLVDDHGLLRAGIKLLLDQVTDVQVVAEASTGEDALEQIAHHRPDAVLLDIALPGMSGLEVLSRMVKEGAATKVVLLTMHANEEYVLRALRLGAAGYVLKTVTPSELESAMRVVMGGDVYMSPAIARLLSNYLQRSATRDESPLQLTPRQGEVLKRIAEGKSTKEIAFDLGISPKTVDMHRTLLMDRLQIRDVASLVRYAIKMGLVPSD